MNMRRKAELMLLLVATIWGGTFAFIKLGLNETGPLTLLSIRFGLSFICFTALYHRKIRICGGRSLARALILGLLMFAGYAFQTIGLDFTSAARAGFITYTYSLFIPFLQFKILGKKPVWGNVLGLGVVFAGLWLLSNPGAGQVNKGDLITFGAAVAYAFYIVYLDRFNREENTEFMTSAQMFVTSFLSLILAFVFEEPQFPISWSFGLSMAYLVLLGSVLCLYFMNLYQKYTTPMRATLIYSLEPVFSIFFAFFLLDESFSLREGAGALLILSGVLLSQSWELITARTSKP